MALGLISLGASLLGAALSFKKQSKAADRMEQAANEQRKATDVMKKKNVLEVRNQKLDLIRRARIARGAAVSRAVSQTGGVGQGSSVAGGIGSVSSQLGGAVSNINRQAALTLQARDFMSQSTIFSNQAVQANNQASIWQGVSSVGNTLFDRRNEIKSVFAQLGT